MGPIPPMVSPMVSPIILQYRRFAPQMLPGASGDSTQRKCDQIRATYKQWLQHPLKKIHDATETIQKGACLDDLSAANAHPETNTLAHELLESHVKIIARSFCRNVSLVAEEKQMKKHLPCFLGCCSPPT